MSSRPESIPPPVDEADHPFREIFLAQFRPEDRQTLTSAASLLFEVMRDGAPSVYCPNPFGPSDFLAAVGQDLDFLARFLVGGLARWEVEVVLSPAEVELCRAAGALAPKVEALAVEVAEILS